MEPKLTLKPQPNLAPLALYLPHGIEVEHVVYGRCQLLGLPYVQPWDRSPAGPHAHLYFEAAPPNEVCSGVKELSSVKPVLYHPADILGRRGGLDHFGDSYPTEALLFSALELDALAQMVDSLRALGIALNLPAGSYVRKELPSA